MSESQNDLALSFTADASPEEVFSALVKVRDWWGSGIEGSSEKKGDSFLYRHKDLHVSRQTVTVFEPAKRLVWRVSESRLTFVNESSEWESTEVEFLIEQSGDRTKLTLVHHGLQPRLQCFQACSGGWEHYFSNSLRDLIVTGKGNPDPRSYSVSR